MGSRPHLGSRRATATAAAHRVRGSRGRAAVTATNREGERWSPRARARDAGRVPPRLRLDGRGRGSSVKRGVTRALPKREGRYKSVTPDAFSLAKEEAVSRDAPRGRRR